MLERVREKVASLTGQSDDGRFVSRTEREDRQRRFLIIATAILALAVVLALAAGALWQYVLIPRETYATVNGVDIRRSDYEKVRRYQVLQQLTGLSQQFQSASEDQRAGIQQQIAALQLELEDLENGEKNINPEVIQGMIDDQIVLQGLDDFGIVLTEEEVDEFIDQLLAPVALTTPTATFTVPPTAAAWATETSEAFLDQLTATAEFLETQTELTATAEAAAPTDDSDASSTESPEETASETATGDAEATGTPTPEGESLQTPDTTDGTAESTGTVDAETTATFTPVATLEPTATPNREQALATSEAGFELLDQNFLDRAEMSRGDFERLIARPALARLKLSEALIQDIPTSQEQVRASHILVATRDAAQELLDGRLQNEDFAVVAEEVSTDTSSAANGGDLGWFPVGVMTSPFEAAAFDLDVGEMSDPVQSEFGWHIILVTDRADDRELTISALRSVRQNAVERWISEQKESASITTDVPLPDENQAPNIFGP